MLLGNDVVDLAATADHHPRFMARILHAEEQSQTGGESWGESRLWAYWAAKEAAYKALRQSRELPFHPREFKLTADLKTVHYQQETLQLIVRREGEAVLAMATDDDPQACACRLFAFADEARPEHQSFKARELLIKLAETELQLPRRDLAITRQARIPRLIYRRQTLPHPVSIAHHGRYVMVALGLSEGVEKVLKPGGTRPCQK